MRALLPYDMNWFCQRRALARSVAAKKLSTQKMTSDARFRNWMGVIASACAHESRTALLVGQNSFHTRWQIARHCEWTKDSFSMFWRRQHTQHMGLPQ